MRKEIKICREVYKYLELPYSEKYIRGKANVYMTEKEDLAKGMSAILLRENTTMSLVDIANTLGYKYSSNMLRKMTSITEKINNSTYLKKDFEYIKANVKLIDFDIDKATKQKIDLLNEIELLKTKRDNLKIEYVFISSISQKGIYYAFDDNGNEYKIINSSCKDNIEVTRAFREYKKKG